MLVLIINNITKYGFILNSLYLSYNNPIGIDTFYVRRVIRHRRLSYVNYHYSCKYILL